VGTLIQQVAAERHCPVTLELGGKSPQIIFADADLDAAIPMVINAIVQNAGQTCSAGSRVLIDELIYEPLLERLGKAFEKLRVGPAIHGPGRGPADPPEPAAARLGFPERRAGGRHPDGGAGPDRGRSARDRLLPGAHPAARRAGGSPPGAGRSLWPGAVGHGFRDEDHAVELANATQFGLVAGVWTRDGARQFRMAKRVRSGQVFINNYGAGGGVELPFGGVKSSGYGREKGFEALYGFTTLKTVAIKARLSPSPPRACWATRWAGRCATCASA
jgi:aldehyde dehydrogenase (NAD+)